MGHDFVRPLNDSRDRCGRRATSRVEKIVWLTDAQIIEEDLIQLVIIVLTGVNQNMLGISIERIDNATHFDNFRPGPHNGHHFKHLIALGCNRVSGATRWSHLH